MKPGFEKQSDGYTSKSPRFAEAMIKIEKAKKRVFYKRLGAFALAMTLFGTDLAISKAVRSNKPATTMSKETLDDDTPIVINANTSFLDTDSESVLPSAGVETAQIPAPTQIDVAVNNDTTPTDITETETTTVESTNSWGGPVLNAYDGHVEGPTGDETFYNLPMDKIVARMHRMGIEGDYWEREDGVKMLGDYVMVAADLKVHPRGSIVETSLGPGIICDTGSFAKKHHNRLDIATNWEDPRNNS